MYLRESISLSRRRRLSQGLPALYRHQAFSHGVDAEEQRLQGHGTDRWWRVGLAKEHRRHLLKAVDLHRDPAQVLNVRASVREPESNLATRLDTKPAQRL